MATLHHDSGADRQPLEKYYTPDYITGPLLEFLAPRLTGMVFDPCAGDGQILRSCWSRGILAHGADIEPEAPGIACADFLAGGIGDRAQVPNIITNPPYGASGRLAVQFIRKSLALTRPTGGVVAMLLRADFDSAPGRVDIFRDHPAWHMRVVLHKRAKWTNVVQTPGKGPSTNHVWYVWDWSRDGGPATVHCVG